MKKILVVDNNRVILKFMTDYLEKKGYQVMSAEDGLSALEALKSYTPDVMFVDLIMPNIGGKKLCQIVRSMPHLSQVYIVILSAVAAEEVPELDELGANACIAKGPFPVMARNVMSVLDRVEKGEPGPLPAKVMGLESVRRRAITKELLSARKHFEVILGSMSEGILEVTPDGKIVYANPVAISLLGRPEEQLLALDLDQLFREEDRPRIKKLMEEAKVSPLEIPDDFPLTANGRQFSIKILPVNENGDKALIVILDDVSLRKRMEAQLIQAQKMEAIGTLAGGIAHDFNNLLMGIQGYASLVLMNTDSTDPRFSHLKGIEEMVQRGSDLTKQLLGFARGGKYDVKPTDLNEIIHKSSAMFGRTRKEIMIREKYQKDLWSVEVDRGQIEQALLNLYVNAWQAMPSGGDLYLQTENVTLDETYVKPFKIKPGEYVKITITDTGVGMDERTRQKIFEPFFTTKSMGRGTGLGLASVYGIIKNHGGFINVYSEKDQGTTFTIYLPASKKRAPRDKSVSAQILTGSETVLLVDDEHMILEVAKGMLESLGYQVLPARNGKEALEIYRENQEKIDLVILDMIMPGISGGETFDSIKSMNPEAKVLLSSGYSIDGQAKEIMGRGCDGFIQKPFDVKTLSLKVREILDKE